MKLTNARAWTILLLYIAMKKIEIGIFLFLIFVMKINKEGIQND